MSVSSAKVAEQAGALVLPGNGATADNAFCIPGGPCLDLLQQLIASYGLTAVLGFTVGAFAVFFLRPFSERQARRSDGR